MNRTQKADVVKYYNGLFTNMKTVIIFNYHGLNVAEITQLRKSLREAGANVKVTKNSLVKLALKDTKFTNIEKNFTGPTAIAFSNDPVTVAKTISDFAKTNEKLVVVCGALEDNYLTAEAVGALAKLPSLDELRAKIIGILSTPATNIARILQTPATMVARVLNEYAKKA